MASEEEDDLMINMTRDGLEQALQAVEAGGPPLCIATEVAEKIAGITNADQDLAELAARHGCDLLASHILHKGDLVAAHIFMKQIK